MIVHSIVCGNKLFAGTSHLLSKKERKNYKLRFAHIVGEHVALVIGSIMYRYINITDMNKLHCFQWRNFVPGCPWVPVAQSGVDAPGEVILGTTQLTQGCNAQAWVPPNPGCPRVCPP